MLDMSVRAKILQLMLDLQATTSGLTYVYITHDLATAKFFCDRIAIMYLGRIVEIGPADEIFAHPRHPYTRALLAAIPEPDPVTRRPARPAARRGTRRRTPPGRLLVPPALPARLRALRLGGPRPGDGAGGPVGEPAAGDLRRGEGTAR